VSTNLENIPGIGPKTIDKLNRLGIKQGQDLIYHFPHRYLDFRHSTDIAKVQEKQNFTLKGQITHLKNIYTKTGKNIQTATLIDKTGQINLIWFNQPYLLKTLKEGQLQAFAGAISLYQNKPCLINPVFGQYHTGKIMAIYPETAGLTSNWFRKTIQSSFSSLVSDIKEPLPTTIIHRFKLMSLPTALRQIHFPDNPQKLHQAQTRLKLAEILSLQILSYRQKQAWQKLKPQIYLKYSPQIKKQIKNLIDNLPFSLTSSQKKVWSEIRKDLLSSHQTTNRLLQGDVGSGKTIIGLLSCYLTSLNCSLSLFVVPTEILARQHFQTFKKILKNKKTPLKLLTAKSKINWEKISPNTIVIATHAAIYQKHKIKQKVALLIVDEQHKFGVKQRNFLQQARSSPHRITMTATPIPRSISLTMLGNLNLSIIKHPPKNRLPVKTFLVPTAKIPKCYRWIEEQIQLRHNQAFIVCPFIDQSDSLDQVKSAKQEFIHLSQDVFPHLKLGLIHGQTPLSQREDILKKFQKNKINILVTTPIIEVGIDIKNATIMVVQSAERFGLAQLHQLRGRVGRGDQQSYCYFFTQSENEQAINRLKFLQNHKNGLNIAKYDLANRGPGEVFSTLQHGFPSLKLSSLSDLDIINLSQDILQELIGNLGYNTQI